MFGESISLLICHVVFGYLELCVFIDLFIDVCLMFFIQLLVYDLSIWSSLYLYYIFVCQYALSKLVFILWSFHPHHYPHGHHYHDHGHKVIIMMILIILRIPHHFYSACHTSSFDMVPMLEILQVSEISSTAHAFTAWDDFLWSPKLGMWQSRCLEFVAYSFLSQHSGAQKNKT